MFLKQSCQPPFYKSELVAWNEWKHLLEAKCKSIRGHRVHGPCGQKHRGNPGKRSRTLAAGLLRASDLLVEVAVQRGPEVLCGLDDHSVSHWLRRRPVSMPRFTPLLYPEGIRFLFSCLILPALSG